MGADVTDLLVAAGDNGGRVLADALSRSVGAKVPPPRESRGGTPKLTPYDLARMAREEAPPVPWVIENFAARQEVTQLWGRPGSMKSLLMMALGGAVAHGEELAGMDTTEGEVIYFDAENGQGEFHRRVRNLDLPAGRFHAYGAMGAHLVRDRVEFEEAILEHPPSLVIFDSLRRLLPGTEENDSDAMAEAVGAVQLLAKRHDFAGVVIHHGNKAGTSYRGSSAIEAEVSISFKLAREASDPDRTRRYLECEKCRVADEPERRWLNLAVEFRKVYVQAAAALAEGDGEAPAQAALAPRVMALFNEETTLYTRPEIAERLDRTKKDGTVRRVVAALVERGQLIHDGHHYRRGCQPAAPLEAGTHGTPTENSAPEPSAAGATPNFSRFIRRRPGGPIDQQDYA